MSNTTKRWICGFRKGQDDVIAEFWQAYEPRLRRLAERNLAGRMRRRLDPDDLVQSAFRTFLRRAARHEFELKDRDMLMSLLCTILLNKVRRRVRDHSRQKRGVDREQYFDTLADVQGQNPTPEEEVAFQELEQLIQTMGKDEQLVVSMKLAGHSSKEIATELKCSARTVRRILKRIQDHLAQLVTDD
ncbi:MAG TPA: hypothetical protein DCE47_17270 [Planctomycetaceae bacterium]|nr:hypothetical protein [Planctomycetaceae bacterium]|tara:strand:- start:36 stop:599 length:564 start_codon:yes stop_codon:yes gene_type:complete